MLKTFPTLTGRGPSPSKALADVTNHLKLPLIWHLAAESPDAWAPGSLVHVLGNVFFVCNSEAYQLSLIPGATFSFRTGFLTLSFL